MVLTGIILPLFVGLILESISDEPSFERNIIGNNNIQSVGNNNVIHVYNEY